MRAPPKKQGKKWLDRLAPQRLVRLCKSLAQDDTLSEESIHRCAAPLPPDASSQIARPSLQEHIFFLESLPRISSLFSDFTFLNTISFDNSDSNSADLNTNEQVNFEGGDKRHGT